LDFFSQPPNAKIKARTQHSAPTCITSLPFFTAPLGLGCRSAAVVLFAFYPSGYLKHEITQSYIKLNKNVFKCPASRGVLAISHDLFRPSASSVISLQNSLE
jgi:hypothetical protein